MERLAILVVVGMVSLAGCAPQLNAQESNPKLPEEVELAAKKAAETDLSARKTELLSDSSDLEAMMNPYAVPNSIQPSQ